MQGGHWVSTYGRRLSTNEMLRLQHMRPDRFQLPSGVSDGAFRGMTGNAMSVNVVEVILSMLSKSVPSWFSQGPRPLLLAPASRGAIAVSCLVCFRPFLLGVGICWVVFPPFLGPEKTMLL